MTDRSGRIVGGHGTHNRPWIIDEYENGPVNASAAANRRRPSVGTSSHLGSTPVVPPPPPPTSQSRRRAAASSSSNASAAAPLSQHVISGADSVASGATESSYERYLAQRRAEAAALVPVAGAGTASSGSSRRLVVVPRNPSTTTVRRPAVDSSAAIPSLNRSNSLTQQPTAGNGPTQLHPSIPSSSKLRQRSASDHEASRLQTRPLNYISVDGSGISSNNSYQHYVQNQAVAAAIPPSSDGTSASRHRREKMDTAQTAANISSITKADNYSTSSRDLRAKRLAQQRQDALVASQPTTATASKNDTVPMHFQAHDAAVENYLTRSRLVVTDPGRSRTTRPSEGSSSTITMATTKSAAPRPSPVVPRQVVTDQRVRTATVNSSASPVASTASHKPSSKKRSGPVVVPIISDASLYNTAPPSDNKSLAVSATAQAGWSTLPRTSGSGHTTMTTQAIAQHEAYKAKTVAEVAKAAVPMSSGCDKVDQYLAQRQALKQRANSFTRLGKKKQEIMVVSSESMATLNIASVPSATVSFDESSADDSSDSESESNAEEPVTDDLDHVSEDDVNEKEWSVKVCVVSAVDFPANVVPNLPFSPLLRVGLVQLESTDVNPQGEDVAARRVDDARCRELASLIERNGILTIPKSRVRCTNSKILSKRDNGSAEFHEEMRWDGVRRPEKLALALELSSRAVLTPANIKDSPPQQFYGPFQLPTSTPQSAGRGQTSLRFSNQNGSTETGVPGLSSLFRKIRKSDSAEMEEANAAAAVAKLLVQGEDSESGHHRDSSKLQSENHQSEINVTLRRRKRKRRAKMTDDFRLGAKVIPLSRLPLANAFRGNETIRIEQWFELDTAMKTVLTSLVGTSPSSSTATRNPSILLEISLCAPERLDDSEDDMGEVDGKVESRASYSKRASMKIRNQLKQEAVPHLEKVEEPMLEPGIVDFVCVVGARDIGDQKSDDGSSGWVDSSPECTILEQFPSIDEFHVNNGRTAVLPGKVEWFCFPEGCKIWRGLTPPNHDELNLKRFSATSPSQFTTSIASFDACLGCTTSFSWFSISSNSDQYGSESKKTYGAVIRFYVPAPIGVDPTQDDFARTFTAEGNIGNGRRRLWVPIGLCMTSSMPIIGPMEAMLLRLCEGLSSTGILSSTSAEQTKAIQEAIVSVIVSFQKPIPGIVNCSFPFLEGERLHIALPSRSGLPSLPHGGAVASVCRLLGADGVNYLFAAFLTECKILLHSDEISNLSLVSEVMTALLYPFQWSLPCVPVLPVEMMEFLEAPVSYLLGVPSCNMQHVDPSILEDIVVVDLDRDFSSPDGFEGRRYGHKTKMPVPLPATMASNISKAVYRLLRAEDEEEESYGADYPPGVRYFPRMEPESLPEREFRLAVAIEVCGLIRGFDECLVFSSSHPVFNVDKFLQVAPSIFEDQRIMAPSSLGQPPGQATTRNMISPRSRRFVSLLVCCQHFHQFLDVLETESLAFFRLIMRSLQSNYSKLDSSLSGMLRTLDATDTVAELCKTLQSVEDKTATYRVKSYGSQWPTICEAPSKVDNPVNCTFPFDLLQQIRVDGEKGGAPVTNAVSVEYLVELQKNPWRYQKLLDLDDTSPSGILSFLAIEKVAIREAIGDRRYRAWKSGYFKFDSDETSVISEESKGRPTTLDLVDLIRSIPDDNNLAFDAIISELPVVKASKSLKFSDLLILSFESGNPDWAKYLASTEDALQKQSAQTIFLAVLRKRIENDLVTNGVIVTGRRRSLQSGGSKLDSGVFKIMIRLSFAMLDACQCMKNYDSAYSLLKMSAGLYAAIIEGESEVNVVYLTERIGLHPVYAELKLWDMVYLSHVKARQQNHSDKDSRNDKVAEINVEYEAAVATLYEMNGYGIPAEELARFAYRMCLINDWIHPEKGQSLLMLAKRVCIRRDHGPTTAMSAKMSDVELISPSPRKMHQASPELGSMNSEPDSTAWIEVGWCHPMAQSSRRAGVTETSRRSHKISPAKSEEQVPTIFKENTKYMRRSAVTCLAYLGSSVVVSGGLDGGVFIARRVPSSTKMDSKAENVKQCDVRGVHLDWGSSGSRYSAGSSSTSLDGEYGVGAVTCLAATCSSKLNSKRIREDVVEPLNDEEILNAMEGIRIVAGTTCGDLRVWSVKDVFSAVFFANRGGGAFSPSADANSFQRSSGGTSSSFVSRSPRVTDFAAGSSLTRLKFSLRGRALSGHRGGVSCVDVHSNVYRPDSIVSGGADGLIKLWSLKTPGLGSGRTLPVDQARSSSVISSSQNVDTTVSNNSRSGDALSILSGHGGRVLCVKTAWHGDRLLSGGADRTVRLWDLAGSGGKCLNTLSGHFGWVTSVHYWGPNTIVSASTDRSLALWDVRVRNSPLFILRHHHAPISDVLLGPRSDPIMISAAADGSIAAWDFRQLTGESSGGAISSANDRSATSSRIIRKPAGTLYTHKVNRNIHSIGPVHLRVGLNQQRKTAMCLGSDAVIREWDYQTGNIANEYLTGHCDTISSFVAVGADNVFSSQLDSAGTETPTSTISASWDGTIRMRSMVLQKK